MPFLVSAQQTTENLFRYTNNEIVINIQPDGTYTKTIDAQLTILDKTAISAIGTMRLPYNASLQELEVLEAATIKSSGQRINVDPAAITTQGAPNVNSLMIMQDLKMQTIVFPNLEVGDSIFYKTRITQKTPDFPNRFSMSSAFLLNVSWENVRVTMHAPKSLKLKTDVEGVEGGLTNDDGSNQTWVWTYRNTKTVAYESGAVSILEYTPHISISSFADYRELAAAYQTRAQDKAKITPAIQALADELTAGVPDRREQVKRLYDWVAKNIRYVAIYLDVGGFVPHPADAVLANRYGDCKDHVVLLEALLAAKSIPSTAVLINSLNNYTLPKVALPQAFNHAITFVSELNLYLDSTNPFAPFGVLPGEDSGKPVIHTVDYNGVQRTPPVTSENFSWSRSVLNYSSDGSIDASLSIDTRAQIAISMRQMANNIQKGKEDEFIRQALAASGLSGVQGSVKKLENVSNDSNRLELKYSGKNALNFSSAGALPIGAAIGNSLSFSNMVRAQTVQERKHDYSCSARTVQEDFEINLPPGVQILAIPRNVSFEMDEASYQSTYIQNGNKINASRRLVSLIKSNVCDPGRYIQQKKMNEAVIADLKAQILFMPLQ